MNKEKYEKIIINLPLSEQSKIKKIAQEEKRTLGSLGLKAIADYVKKLEKAKLRERIENE